MLLAALACADATPLPTAWPTKPPMPAPTPHPTKLPTAVPSITPVPTVTFAPTDTPIPAPSGVPTIYPTPSPSELPTPKPTAQPTMTVVPTLSPSFEPTPLPTPQPTTQADFLPAWHVTMLVKCLQEAGNKQGPSNQTYNVQLRAGTSSQYRTNYKDITFRGLGIVDKDGKALPYDDYDASAGDKTCDENQGGGDQEMALIHDQFLGSAAQLRFKDNNGAGLLWSTQADFNEPLNEVHKRRKRGARVLCERV